MFKHWALFSDGSYCHFSRGQSGVLKPYCDFVGGAQVVETGYHFFLPVKTFLFKKSVIKASKELLK